MKILINEYRSMSANEHVIWDSEIDYYDEAAMEEIKADWYQEYVDGCEMSGEEPDDFETWYDDYVSSMWDADWEMLKEDLESYVLPEIDKQINNDILLLSGSYGSNYPDFRPSGDGGILWDNGTDDLEHFMFDFDRCQITSEDGIIGIHCADHDGTISGQLFTLPDDVTELAKALGYEDEEDFDTVLYYGEIDSRDLNTNINLMKPIKDTISGYNK